MEIKGSFFWGVDQGAQTAKSKKFNQDGSPKCLGNIITLKELDLSVSDGEFVCIVGGPGSGKSSLLSALAGDLLYAPQAEIEVFGGLDKIASDEEL